MQDLVSSFWGDHQFLTSELVMHDLELFFIKFDCILLNSERKKEEVIILITIPDLVPKGVQIGGSDF